MRDMGSGSTENHTDSSVLKVARGLTGEEARQRLLEFGPNAVKESKPHPLLSLLAKFWAPVPWMLEATVVLELILGRLTEAVIVGLLLMFNASLGFFQERRAEQALAMLRQRLAECCGTAVGKWSRPKAWFRATSFTCGWAIWFRRTCGWKMARFCWTSRR